MRVRLYLAGPLLLGIGLVGLHSHYSLAPARSKLASHDAPQVFPEYFAEQSSDCNVELLNLAQSASGPFKRVFAVGENPPHERLRRNVWELGRYRVRGRFTGKSREFADCASLPEFEVLEFRPWGPIQRCASPGALDATMLLYTGDLPEDRYAPEDFIDGPWPPSIDDGSCRLIGTCASNKRRAHSSQAPEKIVDGDELPSPDSASCLPAVACESGERRVNACSGDIWCCRLSAVDAPPGQ